MGLLGKYLSDHDLPVYLRETYLLAKNQRLDWYNSIVDILDIDLDQMCDRLTVHPNALLNEVKQRLTNSFIQDWNNQLQLTTGKLRL